ncbi:hypothetical protein AZH11_25115 [Pseudomonas simiae]|nr:hypothetical protein AZH11_25115 [Pseudomonas simiae]
MGIYIERLYFENRAPFDILDLNFEEREIAVLTATNGRGKTTILSHIVDAFHEFAKVGYDREFSDKPGAFYRTSTVLSSLKMSEPSVFYMRCRLGEDVVDYIDYLGALTEDHYNTIPIDNKIPFEVLVQNKGSNGFVRYFNILEQKIHEIFDRNLCTYFPAYRFEKPGYINDVYDTKLSFGLHNIFNGYLKNPIEVVSGMPLFANWLMDVVLDQQFDATNTIPLVLNLNTLFTLTLSGKSKTPVKLGIGPRGYGRTRIQISDAVTSAVVYPSIFGVSSGEAALICLFGELLKQCDKIRAGGAFNEVTGIVLVDEIDKHLHLKLQKEALPQLINLFPNVQFIVSSHSPFFSMGLAENAKARSKIVDLDNFGVYKDPTSNELYREVYEMLVNDNERFRDSYFSLKNQIEKGELPLIVTEGKTDILHLKSAKNKLGIVDDYEFFDVPGDWGDSKLKALLEQISKLPQKRKVIGIFDRDVSSIVRDIEGAGESFKNYGNNVYAFCIPVPPGREGYENISIEFYYSDEDLKREHQGKRIHFDNEVQFIVSAQNQANKSYVARDVPAEDEEFTKKIFDKDVAKMPTAHSKAVFATLINSNQAFSERVDFDKFNLIFAIIKKITG